MTLLLIRRHLEYDMALTPAQIFEHTGRMIHYAFNNMLTEKNRGEFVQFAEHTLHAGKQYVLNGAGIRAEREEAMLAFHRGVFEKLYNQNPSDGASGQHAFEDHYLTSQDHLV